MTNLEFFKACFSGEMKATVETIRSMPTHSLEYTPHPINRTAYEIAEHIAAHVRFESLKVAANSVQLGTQEAFIYVTGTSETADVVHQALVVSAVDEPVRMIGRCCHSLSVLVRQALGASHI